MGVEIQLTVDGKADCLSIEGSISNLYTCALLEYIRYNELQADTFEEGSPEKSLT